MIAWLKGIIIDKDPSDLVISVNDVGYAVEASMNTFYQLPSEGESVGLHIQHIIREDANLLYGFYDKSEREVFRLLIKISGIGPRLALTILSGMTCQELIQCIALKNLAALQKIPGIGKKTAERLIVEMQDKWKQLPFDMNEQGQLTNQGEKGENNIEKSTEKNTVNNTGNIPLPFPFHHNSQAIREAMGALSTLGYKPPQISQAIDSIIASVEVDDLASKNSEQWIREALKYFSRV